MLKTLIKCMDLVTLPLSMAGVLLGSASAALCGHFDFPLASLCLIFAIIFTATANVANRYYDYINNYGKSTYAYINYTSRNFDVSYKTLLHEGLITLLIFSSLIGMGILSICGLWAIWFGPFLLLAVYLNSSGISPIAHSPFAPVFTIFFFGPVTTLGTFIVQYMHVSDGVMTPDALIGPTIASFSLGFLAVNSLLVYHIKSRDEDKSHGVKTLTGIIGIPATRVLIVVNSLISFALFTWAWYRHPLGVGLWHLILPGLCALVGIYAATVVTRTDIKQFVLLQKVINFSVLAYGLGLFIFYVIIGLPSESPVQFF